MSTQISLREGERIFMNGAVFRADKRVTLEVLNDVPHLLERDIMQPESTTTPMRQLYFVLQAIVIDPQGSAQAREIFEASVNMMLETYSTGTILDGLVSIKALVQRGSTFAALTLVRRLMAVEDAILGVRPSDDVVQYLEAV